MADTIIEGTNFNCNDTLYRAAKINAQGGKNIRIVNKATQTGLRLSTPLMLTWGLSDYVDPQTQQGNGKFEMALQFPMEEYKTHDTELFLENIKRFEQKILDDAFKNSKEWFGKQHKNPDIIAELFTPMLKYPKIKGTSEPDLNKAPSIRLKVPNYDNVWKVEIYDEDEGKLFPYPENPSVTPLDFIKKGTNVACLIQCAGIWFTNGKFTVSWQLVQAVVQKPRESIVGKCFIKINSKEKEILKKQVVVDDEPTVFTQQATTSIEVADSDEEDEEDEEIEKVPIVAESSFVPEVVTQDIPQTPDPTPEAVVVSKKKVVKKKQSAEA